jgi:serine/threonine-protein kinase
MPSVATPQTALNVRSSSRAKEEEQRRKRRTATIVATIAALFCIAIIGVVIYMLSSDGAQSVEVPDVVNMTEDDARKEIESKGLKVGKVEPTTSPDIEQGRVVSSNPSARTVAKLGSVVDLKISSGPEQPTQVEVPNLRDKTPDDAKAALEAVGLKYDRGDDRYDPEIAVGRVCAQSVEAGTMADVGRIVTYYVSKGKETGTVPNVVGATEQEARDYLKSAGFEMTVAEEREYSDSYPDGVVIRQSPVSGLSADKGSTVTVTLSKGPEPPEQVAMPNLVGLSESDALDAIYRAGLVPNRVYKDTALIAEVGKVISQSPLEKSMVTKGDTVTITVGRSSAPPSP